MRIKHQVRIALLCIAGLMPAVGVAENVVLKEMPKAGDVPFGKIVYVDDGRCPKGEIKEITGGSQTKGVERKVRCVKAPDKAPKS